MQVQKRRKIARKTILIMNNDTEINWQQVRIDASINVMNAILSSSIMVFIF